MSEKSRLVEHQNDFDRYFDQVYSTLSALRCQSNIEEMPYEQIDNVLWLLHDRLKDLKVSQLRVFSIASTLTGLRPADFEDSPRR